MVAMEGRLLLYPLQMIVVIVVMSFSPPLLVHSQCNKNPVIFNFGDSNSDSGGFAAGLGHDFGPPNGRTYFHHQSGRVCDGRLIIDFLCKYLYTTQVNIYVTPPKKIIYVFACGSRNGIMNSRGVGFLKKRAKLFKKVK
jgi:hypothetical protein